MAHITKVLKALEKTQSIEFFAEIQIDRIGQEIGDSLLEFLLDY